MRHCRLSLHRRHSYEGDVNGEHGYDGWEFEGRLLHYLHEKQNLTMS